MAALRSEFEPRRPEAQKLKRRFTWLQTFSDEELRKISMCSLDEGEKQGSEEYFDLSRPEVGSVRGRTGATVPEGSCYVSRKAIGEELWKKMLDGFTR